MITHKIDNLGIKKLGNVVEPKSKANDANFSSVLSQAVNVKISKHANQRLQTQNINIDDKTLLKLQEAVEKASQKGLKNDVLILNGDVAYVVNVKNRVVITVRDMNSLKENIFTNIEGVLMI